MDEHRIGEIGMNDAQQDPRNLKEVVQSLLHYDPSTGIFTWIVDSKNNIRKGDIAGTLDKSTGYIRIGLNNKQYRAHRLAWLYMTGEWPKNQIDHIDRVRDNNAWTNLREVTASENSRNQKLRSTSSANIMGVNFYKPSKKWLAHVCVLGKYEHLGYFGDWFEAVCARKSAEHKYSYHPSHGAIS